MLHDRSQQEIGFFFAAFPLVFSVQPCLLSAPCRAAATANARVSQLSCHATIQYGTPVNPSPSYASQFHFHVLVAQVVVSYQPRNSFFCTRARYIPVDPSKLQVRLQMLTYQPMHQRHAAGLVNPVHCMTQNCCKCATACRASAASCVMLTLPDSCAVGDCALHVMGNCTGGTAALTNLPVTSG
jgi:hypothetical protein